MNLFQKFKAGLAKTQAKLAHEIKRIVTRSPKLGAEAIEELEAALIAADLGMAMTTQIMDAVKKAFETQGGAGLDVYDQEPLPDDSPLRRLDNIVLAPHLG